MAGKRTSKSTIPSGPSTAEQMGEVKATLNYLREDFSLMKEELKVLNQTLAVNTKQLEIHIEGVKLAREQNELLKKDVDTRIDTFKEDVETKIAPIQTHVTKAQTYGKIAAWVLGSLMAPIAVWCATQMIQLVGQVLK
jgi:hypothetical protein